MAIQKTTEVERVEVQKITGGYQLFCIYNIVFDDPNDDLLPMVSTQTKTIQATDSYSNEPQIVRDIAFAIWS
tara:strand:+ start:5993 stop:6208 length:216 start_codon:yes stop_codon:yes gene_type:complete